jgi:putative Ca2+/H+ antiporter (TMEM165/GDT1 family)
LFSEFGDKTFFIAALLAIKNSRLLIFNAAMLAYLLIGVLSCAFGKYATEFIPITYIKWFAMLIFFLFSF